MGGIYNTKLSQLITHLQLLLEQHGDLPVIVPTASVPLDRQPLPYRHSEDRDQPEHVTL